MPKTSAYPEEAPISPVSMDMVVVLPAPLWPSRAKIYPVYILTLRPLTAWNPLSNVFLKSVILRIF